MVNRSAICQSSPARGNPVLIDSSLNMPPTHPPAGLYSSITVSIREQCRTSPQRGQHGLTKEPSQRSNRSSPHGATPLHQWRCCDLVPRIPLDSGATQPQNTQAISQLPLIPYTGQLPVRPVNKALRYRSPPLRGQHVCGASGAMVWGRSSPLAGQHPIWHIIESM